MKRLDDLKSGYNKIQQQVIEIEIADRSYQQDLSPYAQSIYIEQRYTDLINEFDRLLRAFSKKDGTLDYDEINIIRDYGKRVAEGYSTQQGRTSTDISKIYTKLNEIKSGQ